MARCYGCHPCLNTAWSQPPGRIFAYDLQLKAFEAKAADLETLGPVRALDVWQGEGKLLWLASGAPGAASGGKCRSEAG